ncbi:hypothetical protein BRADI_1g37834v3 [Brachypodium distachyon]|uniref:Uncharacterized protein n=1 Tax=Brachypodium distachyon TaxID=15368 RepID=A0A0Q3K199_BRADI|nr:hypothetical protein BRADI_1g37834v3 [Brachypodium distachyon]
MPMRSVSRQSRAELRRRLSSSAESPSPPRHHLPCEGFSGKRGLIGARRRRFYSLPYSVLGAEFLLLRRWLRCGEGKTAKAIGGSFRARGH